MKQKAKAVDQEGELRYEKNSWDLLSLIYTFVQLREAFRIFDRNRDGFISVKELKIVTTMLGATLSKEEIEDFWKEADVVR